ncbi:MAG: hypothetical protein E7262_09705 [Lachnospiraceae bacterium]|nr:hypothetical protein [Lachnospiraceae bacterium]
MQKIDVTEDEIDLLMLYSIMIKIFVQDLDLDVLEVHEIYFVYKEIVNIIDAHLNSKMRKISNLLGGTQGVEVEKSAFDEYDMENGYIEDEEVSYWDNYAKNLDNIIYIAIKNIGNSYKECLDSDAVDLLDYIHFSIELEKSLKE